MGAYPPDISEIAASPKFAGGLPDANCVGKSVTFECGALMETRLLIDHEGVIRRFRYTTNSCGFAVAVAEDLGRRFEGIQLAEIGGEPAEPLISPDEARKHCSRLALEAFKAALADHRSRLVEEFVGEKALICTCFGVSEDTIADLIRERRLTEISEVSEACNAGSGCGSCQMLIRELIDSAA